MLPSASCMVTVTGASSPDATLAVQSNDLPGSVARYLAPPHETVASTDSCSLRPPTTDCSTMERSSRPSVFVTFQLMPPSAFSWVTVTSSAPPMVGFTAQVNVSPCLISRMSGQVTALTSSVVCSLTPLLIAAFTAFMSRLRVHATDASSRQMGSTRRMGTSRADDRRARSGARGHGARKYTAELLAAPVMTPRSPEEWRRTAFRVSAGFRSRTATRPRAARSSDRASA